MRFRRIQWQAFGLAAVLGLAAGCGASGSVGDLPPEKPATADDIQQSADQIKANMGGMGPGADAKSK